MENNTWENIKTQRDELKVKAHLFSMETKDTWDALDKKFQKVNSKLKRASGAVGETREEVWEGHKLIMEELKEGYHKIKDSFR